MKFVALVSGGKDSMYAIQMLIAQGHELVAMLHMQNTGGYVDSYMYQTVGFDIVSQYSECMEVPLYVYPTKCVSKNIELKYTPEDSDEVEDLYAAFKDLQQKRAFEAISSGAILSTYQKNRVESVANRLNLVSLAPLWNKNQRELLDEMIKSGINAVIVKVASPMLKKQCLLDNLEAISKYNLGPDANYCGEGGEYETVVLDCNLFKRRLEYDAYEIFNHPDESPENATVFYVIFHTIRSVKK